MVISNGNSSEFQKNLFWSESFNLNFFVTGHSGICPVVRRPASCPPEISYTCESDIDCQQSQKCCYDGCGKACVFKNLGKLNCLIIFEGLGLQ